MLRPSQAPEYVMPRALAWGMTIVGLVSGLLSRRAMKQARIERRDAETATVEEWGHADLDGRSG